MKDLNERTAQENKHLASLRREKTAYNGPEALMNLKSPSSSKHCDGQVSRPGRKVKPVTDGTHKTRGAPNLIHRPAHAQSLWPPDEPGASCPCSGVAAVCSCRAGLPSAVPCRLHRAASPCTRVRPGSQQARPPSWLMCSKWQR